MTFIDLTTQPLVTTVITEASGATTVTYLDGAGLTLGTLRIETTKYRAFAESLATAAKALYPEQLYAKTNVTLHTKTTTTVF